MPSYIQPMSYLQVYTRHLSEMLARPAVNGLFLFLLGKTSNWEAVRRLLARWHYLRTLPDPRASVEGYTVYPENARLGDLPAVLIFGRPQASLCKGWYGSITDVQRGLCQVTRWQVLNLARVCIHPDYQRFGSHYSPAILPGFTDRHGSFQSTFASSAILAAAQTIGYDYLMRRPPVYLDEPYEIRWLLSYCNTALHKGQIYRAAGFELYKTKDNMQTWRLPLPPLTLAQHEAIQQASRFNRRSQEYRAARSQLTMLKQS